MDKLLFQLDPHSNKKYEKVTLPVLPSSYEVSESQSNETVNINAVGEVNLLGHRALRTVTLSSFYPAQNYNFCVVKPELDPYEFIERLSYWKRNNVKLYFKAGEEVNFLTTISELNFGENDGSGDVNFTIELTEYRELGTKRVKKVSDAKTYTVKSGDTVQSIAKRILGKAKYGANIYKLNKKKIEKKWKTKRKNKAMQDAIDWNSHHPSNTRDYKYFYKKQKIKNSHNGKYLVPGMILTIPSVRK